MRKLRRFVLPWQAVLLLTASTSTAWAEPPEEGARARLVRSADQAFDEDRLADSRDAWLAIWELEASTKAACNVGQLSLRIDDMPMAAEFLTICLKDAPEPTDPDGKKLHEQRVLDLAQARQAVGALTFRVRERAELTLDGKPVGRAPLDRDLFVKPGRHRVRAELDGEVGEADVDIAAGEQRRVVLDLIAPPEKPRGWVIAVGATSSSAFVAAGVGLLVAADAAQSESSDLRAQIVRPNGCSNSPCTRATDAYEAYAYMKPFGYGAIALGAAFAAGTLTYTFWPRSSGPMLKVGTSRVILEGTW
jgi:hypothetical protein